MQHDEMTDASMSAATAASTAQRQRVSSRTAIVPRRGRKPADFWVSFTTMDEPYKSRSAPCRHCFAVVNYHKKWEQARGHLLKCEPFLRLMQTTAVHARPEWFAVEIEKRRHLAARHLPIDLAIADPSSDGHSGITTVTFKPSSTTASNVSSRAKRRESLGSGKTEWSSNSELLVLQAIHAGAPVDPEFVRHLLAREHDAVRSLETLVNKVYLRVRHCVAHALRATSTSSGLPVLVVQWDDKSRSVEFAVAKDGQCYFIERTSVPETPPESIGDASPALWLVGQIKRVVEELGVRIHSCVLGASAAFVSDVISVWSQELLTITQIRYSPLQALVEMVNDVLQSAAGSEADANPLAGLLPVALLCHDVLCLLGAATPMPSYLSRHLDTTPRAVGSLRSLSIANAFWAIQDADKLLDLETVRALVGQTLLDSTTCGNVVALVEDIAFTSQLQRFRAVLQPLHDALGLTEQRVVHASDVFVAWTSIKRRYRDSDVLNEAQKQLLLEEMGKYEDRIVQDGYAQVHLLDPAYLGELLDVAAKAKAEHELLATAGASEEDLANFRQALYVEYTQFQVAAVQQQQACEGDDGFVLRMLKERKKTMVQYWLTDGRRWPRLQTIALGLEQAAADAGLLWARADLKSVLPPGSCDSDKQVYLQRNGSLFTMTELANVKSPPSATSRSSTSNSGGLMDVAEI